MASVRAALSMKEVSVRMSGELYAQVEAKAIERNVSVEQAIQALLRIGLEEQVRRESELLGMIREYREKDSEDEALGDRIGKAIFRK